jgi:hypothetical protein
MRFLQNSDLEKYFKGKTVAVVGSGPSVLQNNPKHIDSFDIVVRVNNFKLTDETGYRTDVYYSYFGGAIKKTVNELISSGVKICIAKCPNCKFMDSPWHERHNKRFGVDFRYIYSNREDWWFCDTFVPENDEFLRSFFLLDKHIPTTGFSAIYKVLSFDISALYITGFDFFESGVHNVNERWKKMNNDDPIGHRPELEKQWLINNLSKYPILLDNHLTRQFKHAKQNIRKTV